MPRRSICARTVLLTSLALFLATATVLQAGPPIAWQPEEVRQTLGNGTGFTTDSTVSLTSTTALSDVELWVVPALQPFVSVFPERIPRMQAGVPVPVRLHYSIPPRAAEGTYEGTVHLRVRSKTVPATLKLAITLDYGDNVISASTHVLDEAVARSLVEITDSTLTFTDPTSELLGLRPGDVIAFGITSKTPGGLLRRVLGSSMVGSLLVLDTEQGSLEDVIEKGAVTISHRLTPSESASLLAVAPGTAIRAAAVPGVGEGFTAEIEKTVFDEDRDPRTTDDQVRISGRVSVDPSFTLDLEWDGGLKRIAFVNTTTETGELSVFAGATVPVLEGDWEILRHTGSGWVVWISWFPLVIQPVLTANVGVEGEVTAGMTAEISPQVTVKLGSVYDRGNVDWIAELDASFNPTPPRPTLGCHVKGYVGPQLILRLQGLAGPYVEGRLYAELEADLFDDPWWKLFGGFMAGTGVRAEIFGRILIDFADPDLIDYRRLLLQATGPSPLPGEILGSVKDAVTRGALPDVRVRALQDGVAVGSATTDQFGTYRVAVPAGDYLVEFTKDAYLPAYYHGISVTPGQMQFLEAVLQIDTIHSGPGDVGGSVVSALDGVGVDGLRIDLRAGLNVRTGTVVASTLTGGGGTYVFRGLPAGQYTAEAGGTGWLPGYFSVICVGGMSTGNQNGTVTPVLAAGETRIILTWGALPTDLDSHLSGPLPDGTRFHMYYPYAGNSPWPTYVALDHDDVTSYGPETTTVLRQIDGVYRFSVHDYSNRLSTTSTALSNSDASVRVYRGSSLVAVFNVPPNQAGTLWSVFELEGDAVTPVNTLSFASDPVSVLNAARGLSAPTATGISDWLPGPLPAKR